MRREGLVYLALLLLTVATFWPVSRCAFLSYDDPEYVSENPHVQQGLTLANIGWAFQAVVVSNWHPVTCLSHMLDCELFGNSAAAPHLINLLLHVVNTLLLFHVLWQVTRAFWPGAMVAALFAVHPLHVESVAWISERKDVLSAFFGLLTLWAYARFVEFKTLNSESKISARAWYGAALFLFALGLMSKPMLVTWPFVLLLLDFWPLKRFEPFRIFDSRFARLFVEKLPFFALAIASSVITLAVQRQTGATSALGHVAISARIANALVSYLRYLGKTIWPSHLAVFYPHPAAWAAWKIAGAAAWLALLTATVVWQARRRPFLIFGWLWFLGTLVPVIGLVQVGKQSMADRYSYIPLIGVFVMTAWSANEIAARWRHAKLWLGLATVAALAACVGITCVQVTYWQNDVTLFSHAVAVTSDNDLAEGLLGCTLIKQGKTDEGIAHLKEELRIKPGFVEARTALAQILAYEGRIREAIDDYRKAIQSKPDLAEARNNLAWILATNEDPDIRNGSEAVRHAERACELTHYQKTIYIGTLAAAYAEAGRYDDAIKTAESARDSALASGETELAEKNLQLLELYRAGKPYHETKKP